MPSTADPMLVRNSFMRASDALATSVATYAIPLLILTTTRSTALTGVAFLLEWLPRLTSFAVGGPLADRLRADRFFRSATIARALMIATAAVALWALPPSGTAATAVAMTTGAVSGLLGQASFVAVETMGAHASRNAGTQAHRVQSVQIAIDQGAQVLGPLLGGLLLMAGPTAMLLAVAILSISAAVSTAPMPASAAPAGPFALLTNLRTGWHTVKGIPALAWLVTGLIASNLALAVTQASSPITVLTHYGDSTLVVGTVWSVAGVAGVGAVAASRCAIDRFGLWPVGASAAAIACAACLGAALAPDMAAYTAAITVLMAGEGAMTVVLRTLRARLIPEAVFGSTLSVTIVLVVLPMPIAGALIAALPAAWLSTLLLACAAGQGAVMAVAFRGLWRSRDSYDPMPPALSAPAVVAPAAAQTPVVHPPHAA